MPIYFPEAPEQAISALARLVKPAVAGTESVRFAHSQRSGGGGPKVESVLANFVLDARDVLWETPPASARPAGWRFLYKNEAGELLSSNVALDDSGHLSAEPSVNVAGPFVATSARVLEALKESSVITDGSYEARMLRFPSLGLYCIWLKGATDGDDWLVPIPRAPHGVRGGELYRAADLYRILKPKAELILNSDTSPKRAQ